MLTNSYDRPAKALDSFIFLRSSPAAQLLGARDFIYAHFQLEMECESSSKRAESRKERKSTVKKPKPDQEPAEVTPTKEEQEIKRVEQDLENDAPERGQQTIQGDTPALYAISETHWHERLLQTFQDPRSRRALVCASTAMISQQLCGINTIGLF